MSIEEELVEARRQVAELQEELECSRIEHLDDTRLRATRCADELLTCALTINGLDETAGDELDIALDTVRRRAEEHGILRRRPPRAVR